MLSRTNKLYIILLIAILSFSGCLFVFNSTVPTLPLRIGISPWPGYETLFLARNLGYLENSSIRLVELPSAIEVMHALRNESLEVATLTLDETVTLLASGVKLKIVAVMGISSGVDALLAQPQYQSLQDLKGKRIGVENTAVGATVLESALEKAGMNLSEFVRVSLTKNKHSQAYTEKKIDAVITSEPVKSDLISQGALSLFDSSLAPGRIVNVLIARSSILDAQTSTICSLVKAQIKALSYFKTYSRKSAKMMASRLQIDPEYFLKSFQGIILPDFLENRKLLNPSDISLYTSAKQLVELMLDYGFLKKRPNIGNFIDNRCVKGKNFE
ncbi:MAG: ABC transporter substrate-binding protein [Methylococcaceae bacterium]|nr:ABC transporter substrate-binding protein [Methylococcaceae bacterium]